MSEQPGPGLYYYYYIIKHPDEGPLSSIHQQTLSLCEKQSGQGSQVTSSAESTWMNDWIWHSLVWPYSDRFACFTELKYKKNDNKIVSCVCQAIKSILKSTHNTWNSMYPRCCNMYTSLSRMNQIMINTFFFTRGGGGHSHSLPIRVWAAQRGHDSEAPDLERGIHFRAGIF